MRYVGLGALGYGLQIAVYLWTAVISGLLFTNPANFPLNFRGLNILGLLIPIPGLLIGLAWFYAGRERKMALFTATGITGVIIFALSLVSTLVTRILIPQNLVQPQNPSTSPQLFSIIFELAAFGAVVGLLALSYFVLETISFFSAGKNFQVRMFSIAGWSRIFAVIAAGALFIVAIFLGILSAFSSLTGPPPNLAALQVTPAPSNPFASLFGLAVGGVYLILAIPEIFAFLGFRKLRASIASGLLPPISSLPPAQTGMKFCPNCGTPTVASSRFCSNCGSPLQ